VWVVALDEETGCRLPEGARMYLAPDCTHGAWFWSSALAIPIASFRHFVFCLLSFPLLLVRLCLCLVLRQDWSPFLIYVWAFF